MKPKKHINSGPDFIDFMSDKKVLVISAHPEDEIAGAAILLTHINEPSFLHTTDGAPKDKVECVKAGYFDLKVYAEARRAEFRNALFYGNIEPNCCYYLEVSAQETIYRLDELLLGIGAVIAEVKPEIIFTHPYEGGHPDHDSTAFAVHFILNELKQQGANIPLLYEFACFFNNDGKLTEGEFIPGYYSTAVVYLTQEQRKIKKQMLDQYASQQENLSKFPLTMEMFRLAPEYNFYFPPHLGRLYYEDFNWGVTPDKWREIIRNLIEQSDYCKEEF